MLYLGGIGISDILLILIPLILWIWALINVIKSDFKNESLKIIWVIVIILLPIVGSLLYYFIGRSQKVLS